MTCLWFFPYYFLEGGFFGGGGNAWFVGGLVPPLVDELTTLLVDADADFGFADGGLFLLITRSLFCCVHEFYKIYALSVD